jgi:hypothetical protein
MTEPSRKLTTQDPVDAETLGKIERLQNTRLQLADRLLDLEQEKVRVLRTVSAVDTERARVFEEINVSRGLAPNFPVEIDAKTGKLTPLQAPEAESALPSEEVTSA